MKRKYIIPLFVIFLITGCSSSYNLKISDDSFEEEIYANFDNVVIYPASDGIESDDQVTPFITSDHYPIYGNNDIIYEKFVNNDDNSVILKYKYDPKDFEKANSLRLCFENVKYEITDDYYFFDLSGSFYCLSSDELNINIITNNKVLDNNADFTKGNTYSWTINKDNVDDVHINIKIRKGNNFDFYVLLLF